MKVFLAVLVLILNLQTWAKADDIRDFEIEGMSVGDSLLRLLDEKTILSKLEKTKDFYEWKKDNKFGEVYIYESFDQYEYMSFFVKLNDRNYKIYGIFGEVDINNNIKKCDKYKKKIFYELSQLFPNLKSNEGDYELGGADKSGKSKATYYNWIFNNKDIIEITCYDYDKAVQVENHNLDSLDIGIMSYELFEWLFAPRAKNL